VDDVRWLIARELPRLRRYALGLVADAAAADDLVQDCLERALRKQHLWRRHGSIRGWLYRILFRVFLNQGAQRRRARVHVSFDTVEDTMATHSSLDARVACIEIEAAMQRLPPDQRAAIVLTAVEGLSYDEAAEVMGVPIGTLRSRLFRAREQLRCVWVDRTETTVRRVK